MQLNNLKSKYSIISFDKIKTNYIAIPKTGTTSILHELYRMEHGSTPSTNSIWLHSTKNMKFISAEEASDNDYHNLTFTRNPISRAKSAFKDFTQVRTSIGGGQGSDEFLKAFNIVRKNKNFYDIFKMVQEFPDSERGIHFRSQSSFCILPNLDMRKIENSTELFPKLNATNSEDILLTLKEAALIHEIYLEDYTLWENSI